MNYLTAADLRSYKPSQLNLETFFYTINCDLMFRMEQGDKSGELVADIPMSISGETPEIYEHFRKLGFEVYLTSDVGGATMRLVW